MPPIIVGANSQVHHAVRNAMENGSEMVCDVGDDDIDVFVVGDVELEVLVVADVLGNRLLVVVVLA